MAESFDQLFVSLKHWLVALLPPAVQPFASIVISVVALILVFATLFAIATVFERKGLARIQNRYGPNRVGIPFTKISLFGFGQPIADGIKALIPAVSIVSARKIAVGPAPAEVLDRFTADSDLVVSATAD